MTRSEIQTLGDAFSHILLANAAHGLATSSLEGTGEITLRDSLIVAAASVGAKARQAWVLEREILPQGWTDSAVDVMISRQGIQGHILPIAGVELKWWRRVDSANAANRRRDLLKDFFRAAALYTLVEDVAFVALLSTAGSWTATATTGGSDNIMMQMLAADRVQKWNASQMAYSSSVQGAMAALKGKVPICNIFHTELLSSCEIRLSEVQTAFSKVWSVNKPQKTRFLSNDEIDALL